MADLSREELRRLARVGAQARLEELRHEEAAIKRAFPDLSSGRRRAGGDQAAKPARGRKRGRMSAAARKAVSLRMKKYWAERRKAKGGKAARVS